MGKNYYELLGIPENANDDEIKKAYRKLALQWHPDKNSSANAEEHFKAITEAYEVLSDPESKRKYDRGDVQEFDNEDFEFHDPFEIFQQMFASFNRAHMNHFSSLHHPFSPFNQQPGFGSGFGGFDNNFGSGFGNSGFGNSGFGNSGFGKPMMQPMMPPMMGQSLFSSNFGNNMSPFSFGNSGFGNMSSFSSINNNMGPGFTSTSTSTVMGPNGERVTTTTSIRDGVKTETVRKERNGVVFEEYTNQSSNNMSRIQQQNQQSNYDYNDQEIEDLSYY